MDTQGCFEQQSLSSMSSSVSNQQLQASVSGTSSAQPPSTPTAGNSGLYSDVNSALLALSTMLAGIQLFNVSEYIPEEAFQVLRFFTDYARLASAEATQLGTPFQRLVFIVRDSKVSEEMVYGIDGGNKMLEKAIRSEQQTPVPHGRKSSITGLSVPHTINPSAMASITDPVGQQQRVVVKEELRQCFEFGVSCYLLPTPGPKVAEGTSFKGLVKGELMERGGELKTS